MPSAKSVALNARQRALEAVEAKRQEEEAERIRIAREKMHCTMQTFLMALPTLRNWFPGVEWNVRSMGDYGYDCVVYDASEDWPPSFLLKIESREHANSEVEVRVGDYVPDTSMPGYSYFSGGVVKSAADVGAYIESKEAHT